MGNLCIIKSNFIYTPEPDRFEIRPDSYLVLNNGKVGEIFENPPEKYQGCEIRDFTDKLVIPGFVDLHTHAPQFYQKGLGMDRQLLEWLNEYTFKEERRYGDVEYAVEAYERFACELVRQGTTRVSAFATIYKESTIKLFDILAKKGIGAYVGKVNMDRNCPPFLREETETSLKDTEEVIASCSGHPLVKPIITPRFAPTSTERLLTGLGELAVKYHLPVQSHLSENLSEVQWVNDLFPDQLDYHDVYDHHQLFGQTPTLMAHCIHLTEEAITCMKSNGVVAVHCPDSNMNLASGIMQSAKMLNCGVQVGLGSDVGAGHSLSMAQSMVRAIQLSKINYVFDSQYKPLTLSQVFYMATKGGGRFFGDVGSFEKGYDFDALVIDDGDDEKKGMTLLERLQKFIYTGDSNHIRMRFAAGKEIF